LPQHGHGVIVVSVNSVGGPKTASTWISPPLPGNHFRSGDCHGSVMRQPGFVPDDDPEIAWVVVADPVDNGFCVTGDLAD
jgi:hypothetical protein